MAGCMDGIGAAYSALLPRLCFGAGLLLTSQLFEPTSDPCEVSLQQELPPCRLCVAGLLKRAALPPMIGQQQLQAPFGWLAGALPVWMSGVCWRAVPSLLLHR